MYRQLRRLEKHCFPLSTTAAGELAARIAAIDTVLQVLLVD
jgi:hypothetical protein